MWIRNKGQIIEPWDTPICLDIVIVSEFDSKRKNVLSLIGSC